SVPGRSPGSGSASSPRPPSPTPGGCRWSASARSTRSSPARAPWSPTPGARRSTWPPTTARAGGSTARAARVPRPYRADHHYLVAEESEPDGADRVVGYAGLIAYADEAHVATIGVAADRQGRGIGARLLDALLAEADRRSPVVLLEVRADNELAQGLYRRRG